MATAFTIFMTAAFLLAPPAGSSDQRSPGSQPVVARSTPAATSRPTSQPDDPLIRNLISDLGATDFKKRRAAQIRLAELGPTALPSLIRHVNDPSPEIAERVQAIVLPPADPELRVELAVALLATRRPETMERAVYMMFDMPEFCCEPFLARVPAMQGPDRVVGEAIAEQFRTWRGFYEVYLRHYEKTLKRGDESSAARLKKNQTDGNVVNAEAAFQLALEALESSDASSKDAPEPPLTTQPVGALPRPASGPASDPR